MIWICHIYHFILEVSSLKSFESAWTLLIGRNVLHTDKSIHSLTVLCLLSSLVEYLSLPPPPCLFLKMQLSSKPVIVIGWSNTTWKGSKNFFRFQLQTVFWAPCFPLRTACLFSHWKDRYFTVCIITSVTTPVVVFLLWVCFNCLCWNTPLLPGGVSECVCDWLQVCSLSE